MQLGVKRVSENATVAVDAVALAMDTIAQSVRIQIRLNAIRRDFAFHDSSEKHQIFFKPEISEAAEMVYTMEIYIDSGCRNLGTTRAIGSAAAILTNRGERSNKWTTDLHRGPRLPPPTIQRAELTSVILAIDIATIQFEQLDTKPYLARHRRLW
ncbi:hypothetical protein TWF706_010480 [Orbilia oligospora]|nr:hypothetical protein TWF706_010480 [Orbilia oligospora]